MYVSTRGPCGHASHGGRAEAGEQKAAKVFYSFVLPRWSRSLVTGSRCHTGVEGRRIAAWGKLWSHRFDRVWSRFCMFSLFFFFGGVKNERRNGRLRWQRFGTAASCGLASCQMAALKFPKRPVRQRSCDKQKQKKRRDVFCQKKKCRQTAR